MTSAIRAQREAEDGFTLIELLVVVIIIGILAAIAIPAFLNQRERAWQSELTSAVRNSALEIEAEATQNGGAYPTTADGQDAVELFVVNNIADGPDPIADSPLAVIDYQATQGPTTRTTADTDPHVGFSLCITHDQINVDGAGVPTNSVVYLGGVSGSGVQPFTEELCTDAASGHIQ